MELSERHQRCLAKLQEDLHLESKEEALDYLFALVDLESEPVKLTPEVRAKIQQGLDDIERGAYTEYASAKDLMDALRTRVKEKIKAKQEA